MSQRNTRKTTNEFKEEINNIVGNDYTVLGEYITKDTKILMRHNVCGNEFYPTPHNFLSRGTRCPICSKKIKISKQTKTFGEYLEILDKNGILDQIEILDRLDIHQKTNRKELLVKFKIKENGLIFTKTLDRLLRLEATNIKDSCFQLDTETFKARILKRNPNLEFISEYSGNKKRVIVKCTICGNKMNKIANNLMTNPSCCVCNKESRKLSHDELIERMSKYRVDISEYDIDTTTYKNNRSKLKFTHKKCNTVFYTSTHSFISHNKCSCPYCRNSYYEKVIEKFFLDNCMNYQKEKKFEDCRYELPLPFDFMVDDKILIEYDGRQHYLPIYGKKHFEETLRNDEIKNNFCKVNNIPLIRIPYYLYKEIDTILTMIKNNESISKICDYIKFQGSTTIPDEVVKFHYRSRAHNE